MNRLFRAACATGLVFGSSSCALLWGFEDGVEGALTADASSSGQAVSSSSSGGGSTSSSGSSGAGSSSSSSGALTSSSSGALPDECLQREVDAAVGLFVDPFASTTSAECTQQAPCTTIQQAIDAVSGQRNHVYVREGLYTESLRVNGTGSGLFLDGRWKLEGGRWLPQCSEASDGTRVRGTGRVLDVVGQPVELEAGAERPLDLTLAYVDLTSLGAVGNGQSSYGVFGKDAHLRIVSSNLSAGRGADYAARPAAPPQAAGTGVCSAANEGGRAGTDAQPVVAGGFDATGWVPANTASVAATAGSNGECIQPGDVIGDSCTGGGVAKGALGGTAGTNGGAGGAAIAMYLWNTHVELEGKVTMSTVGGGNGGNGGEGGAGATSASPGGCTPQVRGAGGKGGTGAAGQGGPAACLALFGDSTSTPPLVPEQCGLPEAPARGGTQPNTGLAGLLAPVLRP